MAIPSVPLIDIQAKALDGTYRVEHAVIRAVVVFSCKVFQTVVHILARLVILQQEAGAVLVVQGIDCEM